MPVLGAVVSCMIQIYRNQIELGTKSSLQRFAFQAKEKDHESKGSASSYSAFG